MNTFDQYKEHPTNETLNGLLKEYHQFIYNVVWQVVKNSHDAEDLTQNVLLKVLNHLHNLSTEVGLKSWAYRVAMNEGITFYRRRAMMLSKKNQLANQKNDTKDEETTFVIHEHISRLTEDARLLVIEKFFHGKTLEELGRLFNLSKSTIDRKLKLALSSLKDSLQKSGYISIGSVLLYQLLEKSTPVFPDNPFFSQEVINKITTTSSLSSKGLSIIAISKVLIPVILTISIGTGAILYNNNSEETNLNISENSKTYTSNIKNTESEKEEEDKSSNLQSTSNKSNNNVQPIQKKQKATVKQVVLIDHSLNDLTDSLPTSITAFRKKLKKITQIKDKNLRWEKLRKLGILLSDKEFLEAEKIKTTDNVFEKEKKQSQNVKINKLATNYEEKWLKSLPWLNRKWSIDSYDVDGQVSAYPGITSTCNEGKYSGLYALIIYQWAKRNSLEPVKWSQNISIENGGKTALAGLAFSLASIKPFEAVKTVGRLKKGPLRDAILAKVAGEWALLDPAAAIKWIETITFGNGSFNATRLILINWSKANPKSAGLWVKNSSVEKIHWIAMESIIINWTKKNPEEAIDWIESLPQRFDKTYLIKKLSTEWADNDIGGLLSWAEGQNESQRQLIYLNAIEAICIKDPSLALKIAYWIPKGFIRNSAIANIARAQGPFSKKIAFCMTLKEGRERNKSLIKISYSGNKNIMEKLKLVKTLPDKKIKFKMISHMISAIMKKNQVEGLRLIETFPDGELKEDVIHTAAIYFSNRKEGLAYLIKKFPTLKSKKNKINIAKSIAMWWDYNFPKGAVEWISTLDETVRSKAVEKMSENWATLDFQGAKKWTETLKGADHEYAMIGLSNHYSYSNPKKSFNFLKKAPQGRERNSCIESLFDHWTTKNRKDAITAAKSLNKNQGRNIACFIISKIWAKSDLKKARDWAENILPGEGRSSALAGIIYSTIHSNLKDSITSAERLEEGYGKQRAFSQIAWELSSRSLKKMENWLEKLPQGNSKDEAIYIFIVVSGSKQKMKSASGWLGKIQDKDIATKAKANYAWNLLKQNEIAGTKFINESDLPQAEKNQLLEAIQYQ
ncbi:MAG: hypothetical protein COA79_17710 [Planctomycetota bacterium]|nr:MAG: hypothetical protein COA79_17710 [Planctomycetota bacterium]